MYKNCLRDPGQLVAEAARTAKRERDELNDSPRRDYAIGRLLGYHEIVSLMQQQAEAFGIPISEIGLEGINSEEDWL